MEALIEDGKAMAIGLFVSVFISMVLCFTSVALISWSALRQVINTLLSALYYLSFFYE